MSAANRNSNRLIHEKSPYLQQHAHNPVDWYPWGDEAIERAQAEQKPIFLSVGYSACHWCHVMERESFEDEETAKILNTHFISIKVDREERLDIDHIYMMAVQVMTQHGGWPMSVFLTPELAPFYGGTYFPPTDRMGMPSFKKVLLGIANAWKTRRDEILGSASQLRSALEEMSTIHAGDSPSSALGVELIDQAFPALQQNFDPIYGGFGRAPKFFHTSELRILLRLAKRTQQREPRMLLTHTLDKMANGGIYDQLGGGFHRYSTDERWHVPHFEKMLYDNALLARLYSEAFLETGSLHYATVASETLNYVLREMTSPDGGYYSAQDADSEGEEGRFYVWSREEIEKLLGGDLAQTFCALYNITEAGNWEGKNIPFMQANLPTEAPRLNCEADWLEDNMATAKRKLFNERQTRVAPFRDEKILTSWNAMMIDAMAFGFQALNDPRFLESAQRAAKFIVDKLTVPGHDEGKIDLKHSWKDGVAKVSGFLDDYGTLCYALTTLYETDGNENWIVVARGLAKTMAENFWDAATSSFYFTAKSEPTVLFRPREEHDGAIPSASAQATHALLKLGRLLDDTKMQKMGEKSLQRLASAAVKAPLAFSYSLLAVEDYFSKSVEIVIAPGKSEEDLQTVRKKVMEKFIPNRVLAYAPARTAALNHSALLEGKRAVNDTITLFICENMQCTNPVVGVEAIEKALENLAQTK